MLGDDPRRLRTTLDAKDCKRLADALVDGMRRNVKFGSDLLGAQMPVDEPKAIELAGTQAGDARGHQAACVRAARITRRGVRSV